MKYSSTETNAKHLHLTHHKPPHDLRLCQCVLPGCMYMYDSVAAVSSAGIS